MSAPQPVRGSPREEGVALILRGDGIVVVRLDECHAFCTATSPTLIAALGLAVDRIEQDASVVAGVLEIANLDGGGFATDADLFKSVKFATEAERLARAAAVSLRRIELLKKPVIAAVHGGALGGLFEVALACRAIVASDDPRTVFGFPEVNLGLMPAANGLLRVAERAGLRVAIDLGLGLGILSADKARDVGLVDDVCAEAILLDVASRLAKGFTSRPPRGSRPGLLARTMRDNSVARAVAFGHARGALRVRTRGHYPAPERVLDVLESYATRGFDAGAELEAKVFGELAVSETAHRLGETQAATRQLHDGSGRTGGRTLVRAGIVGGGSVGSGVAYAAIRTGVTVRLKEKDAATAGQALTAVRQWLDAVGSSETPSSIERDRTFARLSATTDYTGLRHADLVLEAVGEDLTLKQQVLRDVEALVSPTCVLATAASSIPIAKIARAAKKPERVLGMHYFTPVPKIPFLEVVRTGMTEDWAVDMAVAFGRRQRKTVIVVRDGAGFFTTRILAPMLHEALELLAEGVAIDAIDQAMVDWGFPVGPLKLLDDIGLDVAAQAAQLLCDELGERMTPPWILGKLVADDRDGRKSGRGLYRHRTSPRPAHGGRSDRRRVDTSVYEALGIWPTKSLPVEEIQMRCAISMINEAIRCLGEGVVASARDGDVGSVLALGFPPFRGGPFRYVDTIGAADALRRVQGYSERFGERWRPAPLLVHKARKGERFYD